jgi:hypothetical protein
MSQEGRMKKEDEKLGVMQKRKDDEKRGQMKNPKNSTHFSETS